jgi:hypothetical protein
VRKTLGGSALMQVFARLVGAIGQADEAGRRGSGATRHPSVAID